MKNADKVKGFESLSESNKQMFRQFLKNFHAAWGEMARATIRPVSIKECNEKGYGEYLRFDYFIYGRKDWLHVFGPSKWG